MENSPFQTVRDVGGLRSTTAPSAPAARRRRCHLLVIAIDAYTHWPRLRTAVRGGRELVRVLRRRYGVRGEDVVELFDGDATRRRIIGALERMSKSLGEDDVWIVVFAGHGHLEDTLRTGAWIPVDCPPLEHGASSEWVSHGEVVAWLRGSNARQVLLIADSCFAGELLGGTRAVSEEPTPEQIARWGEARSRRALTSGGNEPVYDGRPDGHSVFMGPLLKRLETAALAVFHSGQLCDWVDKEMSALAVPQRPCEGPLPEAGDDIGGRFLLRRSETEVSIEAGDVAEATPERQRWAAAWNQLRVIRAEEEQYGAGAHFLQAEPSRELHNARRDHAEAVQQRNRARPAGWQDAGLEVELEALVEGPQVSFADVRERLRSKGVQPPSGLAEWWAALKKERTARAAVQSCEQRLRQVTEERQQDAAARRIAAEAELNAARAAVADAILVAKAEQMGLAADGLWPSSETRRLWLKACEELLPDSDPTLAETLVDRAEGVLVSRVWAGAQRVGTTAAWRGLLENLTPDAPAEIGRKALAALRDLDRDAAAKARAAGTAEAWESYLAEFREVAGPVGGYEGGGAREEARRWLRQSRWNHAQTGLADAVDGWWSETGWPSEAQFGSGWSAWLTLKGLNEPDVSQEWAEAAWKAVEAVVWRRVTQAGTREALEAYLQGHPVRCLHAGEARAWLESKAAEERIAAEDAAWAGARALGTADGYRQYVLQWPEGRHLAACAVAWAELPPPAPLGPPPVPTVSVSAPLPPAPTSLPASTANAAKSSRGVWSWLWALAAMGCAVWAMMRGSEVSSLRGVQDQLQGEKGRLEEQLADALARLSQATVAAAPAPVRVPASGRPAAVLQTDPGTGQPAAREGEAFRTEFGMELVWIPAGKFVMGSPEGVGGPDERPQTEVTLTKGFWMGKHEVRQRDWEAVMGGNPSLFKGADLPVERVSWEECVEFGKKLTARMKGKVPEGYEFRLPTEAEWEYACRAGTRTQWSFGDDESAMERHGWYDKNSGDKTHPVGQKPANPWGLQDMHGNVWEWCLDWKGAYPGGKAVDPKGPATGSGRVLRGGSWDFSAGDCRSASRVRGVPGNRGDYLGFRLVLAPRLAI